MSWIVKDFFQYTIIICVFRSLKFRKPKSPAKWRTCNQPVKTFRWWSLTVCLCCHCSFPLLALAFAFACCLWAIFCTFYVYCDIMLWIMDDTETTATGQTLFRSRNRMVGGEDGLCWASACHFACVFCILFTLCFD